MKRIRFCKHAEMKFRIFKDHGFPVSHKLVLDTVKDADRIERGDRGRFIAQKVIDGEHVLRVVYEKASGITTIITFYPGRRKYYED